MTCTHCRATKHRCDGGDEASGVSCTRCTRMGRTCTWPPRKKLGRPKKGSSIKSSQTSPEASVRSNSSNRSTSVESKSGDPRALNVTAPCSEPATSSSSQVLDLIGLFYGISRTFLPILPIKSDFLATLSQHEPILLNAIMALAAPYATSPPPLNYNTIASRMLWTWPFPATSSVQEDLAQVQSSLALAYLEYGRANIPRASELSQNAIQLAIHRGWNCLDHANFPSKAGRPPDVLDALTQHSADNSTDEMEGLRTAWWECWLLDALLHITCSLPRSLDGVKINIRIPRAPARYFDPERPLLWYYPLRIHSLTLLLEAMAFPDCPNDAVRVEHMDQFIAMDTLIDNLILEAHNAWSDAIASSEGDAGIGSGGEEWKEEAAVGRNVFFMTILMLNASSIHLHRKFAIPQVDFDLSVCGIQPLYTVLPAAHPNARHISSSGSGSDFDNSDLTARAPPSSAFPIISITKIISSSKLLFSLLRSTHQSTLHPFTPISGSRAALATKTEDILRQSPFCGCSQVVAGFGAALAVATANTRWQALAAQSDFELAKGTLGRVKRLWAIAGLYEESLDKSRDAVKMVLQLW